MTKSKNDRARRLILRIEKLKAQAKALYDQADTLSKKVGALVGNGGAVKMDESHIAFVTDQFQENDILWAHGAARRWKIEIKAAKL
jgi:hypothetical protein